MLDKVGSRFPVKQKDECHSMCWQNMERYIVGRPRGREEDIGRTLGQAKQAGSQPNKKKKRRRKIVLFARMGYLAIYVGCALCVTLCPSLCMETAWYRPPRMGFKSCSAVDEIIDNLLVFPIFEKERPNEWPSFSLVMEGTISLV